MNTTHRTVSAPFLGLCLAGLCLAGTFLGACSGGGSSGSGSSNSEFSLASVSVQPNATVQINRKIEFTFTKPVDFSTVNLNTISITQVGGAPAAGEFRVKMRKQDPTDPCSIDVAVPNVIVFQPACPTLPDFSDAGLAPGGVQYQVNVVGSPTGGPTVRSTSGDALGESQTFNFNTPTSTQPEILFVDPVVSGGPHALVADPACTDNHKASYIEIGNDPENRIKFVERPTPDANLGADVDMPGFLAPLNLYSDSATRVSIVLQIDQPVNPSDTNVSPTTIRLQYLVDETQPQLPASWANVPHSVAILQNCTETGALVLITPTGILPQGRIVRVVLANSFSDIVGNGNILDVVVGSFRTTTATDPGTMTPGITGDAFTEQFNIGGTTPGSQQDTTTTLDAPPATWSQGQLKASFNFGGTGGPGGHFVYRVRPLANGTTIMNTTFQLITDENQQFTEAVINGQVDVQDLIIEDLATLEVRGPNPLVIRASGNITINGKLVLRGSNNSGVNSYCSANIPASGATGNAGGGRGGAGSYLTTQSTPQGESGFGPFNTAGGGGGGGDSSYGTTAVTSIGAAGGGGGAFAIDVPRLTINGTTLGSMNPACPDQTIVGLDAEDGANGSTSTLAHSPVHPGTPQGGHKGPRPFLDVNPTDPVLAGLDDDVGSPFQQYFHLNDFWGTMRVGSGSTSRLVAGELGSPWAGAGGGGGGDIAGSATFPTVPFTPCNNYKGAGGGGGAGAVTVLCLGNIVFGAHGKIDASGGTGGGGENTNNFNRVGGGSGGGSGGHVILQAGGNIDFRACIQGTNLDNFKNNAAGILARGGEGGESSADGNFAIGGANHLSQELSPALDLLLAPNSYPNSSASCGVQTTTQGFANTVANTPGLNASPGQVRGVGGDGGPGIIQLHVSDPSAQILTPTNATNKMRNLLRPPPVGTTQLNIETPGQWNPLLPIFGRNSKAQSKWIALGATSVGPTSPTSEPVQFFFGGTNTSTGFVSTASGVIPELPAILTGVLTTQPSLPFITADNRSIVVDATTFTDDIYRRNPALLDQFELKVVGTSATSVFEIASAVLNDPNEATVRVTVSASGMPLSGLSGTVSIIPRFFRVSTDGTLDALPSTGRIKIEFQGAAATSTGAPDSANTTAWVTDITALNSSVAPANTALRFFRFRVGFEIGVGQANLTIDSPIPALEFLKVPFKF
jgi:hypothetical protein